MLKGLTGARQLVDCSEYCYGPHADYHWQFGHGIREELIRQLCPLAWTLGTDQQIASIQPTMFLGIEVLTDTEENATTHPLPGYAALFHKVREDWQIVGMVDFRL